MNPLSKEAYKEKFWNCVDLFHGITDEDCWQWMGKKHKDGRAKFTMGHNNYLNAARVVYVWYKGIIPNELMVLHTCDNNSCINPSHLYLGTQQDNMNDMVKRNRHGCKYNIPLEVLKEIKESTLFQKVLAKKFNLTQSMISDIKRGIRK